MKTKTLRDQFLDELKDLYDAENRLLKALPKLTKAANSEALRAGFEEHLEQTCEHVQRLTEIFTSMGEKLVAKKCPGMVGLIEEGDEVMGEDFEGSVMDAALISAAHRVEHYEIAAYGCVRTWAGLLGETKACALLGQTLEEEKETDEKLTEVAEQINAHALTEDDSVEESEKTNTNVKSRGARA
jgi:ferritin-like metal-binding protein YciE